MSTESSKTFEQAACSQRAGLISELTAFLRHNKKWWLAPVLLIMGLLGLLVIAGGSGAAPFVYTLF